MQTLAGQLGRFGRALALTVSVAMAACGGGSEPRQQVADPKSDQFTGQVIPFGDDVPASNATVKAKGATGLLRTTAPATDTTYAVSASGLTGPYLVVSGLMGAVSTGTGIVNLNELARLQSALLLGQSPLDALATFGNGSPSVALVTEQNLAAARAKAIEFLRKEFGVTVPAGASDFINTPFEAVAGDPIFDTLVAINAKIAEVGIDAYIARTDAAVAEARRCLANKALLAVGGEVVEFCPATRSTTTDTADATVLVYTFTSQAGHALTVRARNRTVLSARYAPQGAAAYTCTGSACNGFAVGEAAVNRTRPITFANATLTRRGGATAVFNGSLTAAAPGVVLPTLPCDDNRFFLVLPDTSVIADCVSNTVVDLGLTGTFGTQQGQTDHAVYPFANIDGSNGLPASDPPTKIHLVLDGSTLVSVTATRTDPTTGALTLDFKCRGFACIGVTIGAPVINTDSGFNAQLRRITFDGTELAPVNADGSLGSGAPATLSGIFTAVYIATAEFGGNPPTLASGCSGFAESISYAPSNEANVYGLCPELAGATVPSAEALPLDGGGLRISFPASPLPQPGEPPPPFDFLLITLDGAGGVTRVTIDPTSSQGSSLGASFACVNTCTGVTVSAADAAGNRTVVFTNARLNLVEPDGQPTDARTAVVNGRFTVPVPATGATPR